MSIILLVLEKGSSNLVEFQNLCDLLRIDPAVSKHRSSSTAGTGKTPIFNPIQLIIAFGQFAIKLFLLL